MTLQLLDVAPIRENREFEKLIQENNRLKQALNQRDERIQQLENQLEEISKMTPKERNKFFKELNKQKEKEAKEKQAKEKQTSQVATPFSSVKTTDVDLSQSNQTVTTARTLSTAGMGYDQGSSTPLLSSILIVSAALFLCISGALAYRKNNK